MCTCPECIAHADVKQGLSARRTAGAVLGEQDGRLELVARADDLLLGRVVDHAADLPHDRPCLRACAAAVRRIRK